MRAIILGLCGVLAFAACDGDGGGKGNTPRDGASLDFGTTDGVSNYAFTPLSDDPNEAMNKASIIVKDKETGNFLERTESVNTFDDNGFLRKATETYYYAPNSVSSLEELEKDSYTEVTVSYGARGLQNKLEGTLTNYSHGSDVIEFTYHEVQTFTYDEKDRLSSFIFESISTDFDDDDEDGDGDTTEQIGLPRNELTTLTFTYEEEKDQQVIRHDFLQKADGSKVEISSSTFDHFGIFLHNQTYFNSYQVHFAGAEGEKTCSQDSGYRTDIVAYDAQENYVHSYYARGELIDNSTITLSTPLQRQGDIARASATKIDSADGNQMQEFEFTFQQLKKPAKGAFLGHVGWSSYIPVKSLRDPAFLYGRFFAIPSLWEEPGADAQFIPPSCDPADAAARADAEEAARPPVLPENLNEAPLCNIDQERLADGTCIPTIGFCNNLGQIRNEANQCAACPDNTVVNNNQCVAEAAEIELPPCPEGQHRHILICVDDECTDNQYRNWFGECVALCPNGQRPSWLGQCPAN